MLRKLRIACLAACLGAASVSVFWFGLKLAPRPPLLDDVPFSTLVLARDGSLLRLSLAADEKYRLPARLPDLNPDLIRATLL